MSLTVEEDAHPLSVFRILVLSGNYYSKSTNVPELELRPNKRYDLNQYTLHGQSTLL